MLTKRRAMSFKYKQYYRLTLNRLTDLQRRKVILIIRPKHFLYILNVCKIRSRTCTLHDGRSN
jgi:hypothetical protein